MLSARVLLACLTLLIPSLARAAPPPPPRPQPVGAVCGSQLLTGRPLSPIKGEGECGVADPVELQSAAGVALVPPPTISCDTARALATWLQLGPKSSFAARGQRLDALVVVDAYSCRNRNRARDGKLSEHAFGHAIDIAGFTLADGSTVTMLDGWKAPAWAPTLRRIHDAGCGPFGTVLGPEANALHADHLHLDVEARRSGPFCE